MKKQADFFKRNKLIYKLILAMMVLVFCFAVVSVLAADDKPLQTEKKSTKTSDKCWKRISWNESTHIAQTSSAPVCKVFEDVLNTTCEPSEKLTCKWTLPADEKLFLKLQWQPLDPKKHWELIRDMCLSGWLEKYRAGQWEHYEPEYKKDLDEGRLTLYFAIIDIDRDGKTEHVVRLKRSPDCPSSSIFGVMIPEIKQIDWKYRRLFMGDEIMIYEGRAYMFEWDEVPGRIQVYEGFNLLPNSDSRGSINICQFQYLKGGKTK